MKKTIRLSLLTTTILLIGNGCVGPSAKQQSYDFHTVDEFLARPDIHPMHTNHWRWDRDLLQRIADRDALLNRQ